ncbi:hypothetical protein O181_010090 [Austropuccinia psidii MF-1]|uniref:Uncharacterized protein n=1 Tax=Austropuccinia psidii MF-1 TaxID=1389203 RepID=A0A9Q3BSI6_9BASI|nr:hypothetical protein [Austropuccinia psidii MF-1]
MLLYWTVGFQFQKIFMGQRDVARWTNVGGPILVGGRPVYSSSEVHISRSNTEGVVKRIRQIANSPPDPDAEGSDELDGEEVEVVHNSIGHQSSTSPSHPPAKRLQSHIIPSTPRTFHPTTLPPERPSPVPQSRNFPIVTSQQLQPVASSSRRREELSTLLFPAAQFFQQREHWPIRVTRGDPNMASENQDAVAKLFRRVDIYSRKLIEYANDRTIPGTASEEIDAKLSWYKDELINNFQRTFDLFVEITHLLFLVCVLFDFYPHSYKILKIKTKKNGTSQYMI